LRWESQHVGEVQVESNQYTIFHPAHFDQLVVVGAAKLLIRNGGDLVAGLFEEFDGPAAQVLV
jgi:hypothetical protein